MSESWPEFADGPRVKATFPPFAQEILLQADELEVVAFEQDRGPMPDEREVHGAPVRASAVVGDRKMRVALLSKLYQSVEEEAHAAECFNPHHWILARRGERRVEVLMCFECSQLVVYLDGKSQGFQTMSHAAGRIIGELVGNPGPRLFSGRPREEWYDELTRTIMDRDRDASPHAEGHPVAEIDPTGVAVVAGCAQWTRPDVAARHVSIFEELGPEGAPGAASLARALAVVEPDLACRLARVIARLGPSAAAAVPTLVQILRDDSVPIDRRNHALRILARIGPAAIESLPAVRPFSTHPVLFAAGEAACAAISREMTESASVAPVVTAVPFAEDPQVKAAFTPEVQKLLLEGDLEAYLLASERGPAPHEGDVRGLPIVDGVELTERSARVRLLGALYQGVAAAPASAKECFCRRHALVAYGAARRRAEVIICFESHRLEVHLDGKLVSQAATSTVAEVAFRALVGPIRDRPFGGRTIQEWRAALQASIVARAAGLRSELDRSGVVWVARSVGWSRSVDRESLDLLGCLGPDAAPALQDLMRVLRGERNSKAVREEILRTFGRLGPTVKSKDWVMEHLTYLAEESRELGEAARAALAAINGPP